MLSRAGSGPAGHDTSPAHLVTLPPVSVQRCPNCGRAWDGLLCFACGHEAGKPVTAQQRPAALDPAALAPAPVTSVPAMAGAPSFPQSPQPASPQPPSPQPASSLPPSPQPASPLPSIPTPSIANPFGQSSSRPSPSIPPPTFARSPTPGPQFAPLPPLPPLGRGPTASTALPGVGASLPAPFGASGAPHGNGQPGALPPPPSFSSSLSTPARTGAGSPPSSFPPPATGARTDTAPAPFPAPAFPPTSPGTQLPAGFRDGPAGGQQPMTPMPPVQPRTPPPPGARRPLPSPVATPPQPSSPAAAASVFDEDATAEGELPSVPRWQVLLRRLYVSPAVFGAAFLLGFLVTFGPGALIWLRAPSAEELLEQRRYNDVIAMMKAREDQGSMRAGDWVVYGHALERQYGPLRWDAMLDKYAVAAKEKKVDATALENTIAALGDADRQSKAIEVLMSWPSNSDKRMDPTERLAQHAVDESFLVRHGAAQALMNRNAPAELVDDAWAAVAQKDFSARSCEKVTAGQDGGVSHVGMKLALKLIDKGAKKALKRHNISDLLEQYDDRSIGDKACVDHALADKTLHEYAGLLEGR